MVFSRCFLLLVLLALLESVYVAQGAERSPDTAKLCGQRHEDPKEELACRKRRSWGVYCSDRSQCVDEETGLSLEPKLVPFNGLLELRDVYVCKDESIAKRAGMLCENFPKYTGGYPLHKIVVDDEWEQYTCLAISDSQEYCRQWESLEDAVDEYELGVYTCDEEGMSPNNVTYCKKWSSTQTETKKCRAGANGLPSNSRPTFCQAVCCSDSGCYDCSYAPATENEYSIAECNVVNDDGVCLSWSQQEFDQFNLAFREYEEYQCLEVSENGKYCKRWRGNIDSEEEFEVSTCECSSENNNGICIQWECYEWGISYHFANVWFFWIPMVVPLICTVLMCGCFMDTVPQVVLAGLFINTVAFMVITVRISGMLAFYVFLLTLCLPLILFGLFTSGSVIASCIYKYAPRVYITFDDEYKPRADTKTIASISV